MARKVRREEFLGFGRSCIGRSEKQVAFEKTFPTPRLADDRERFRTLQFRESGRRCRLELPEIPASVVEGDSLQRGKRRRRSTPRVLPEPRSAKCRERCQRDIPVLIEE